jgi:branched-chain amino acid transport system ATP-binding protein
MLQVSDIHTYYGRSYILQGISLEVEPGEIVCLLGRNGVGKTTTLKSIMGFVAPRAGKVMFKGEPITGKPPFVVARKGIGFVPEDRRIFPTLSVEENLLIAAKGGAGVKGAAWTMERIYEHFPRLRERSTNKGLNLSGGEQQMLAIARALMGNPELLILDEPSEGLAPLIVKAVTEIIRTIRESGVTVLLVEQNLGMALSLADRVYVISKGQIQYQGTGAELRANDEVKRRYLGV